MTAIKIFDKYASALIDLGMGEDAPISPDAILLALRLAIGDAYAAGVDSVILNALDKLPPQKDSDQRQQESLQAQITRLNEWLAANRVALYHNPDLDTAAAMIQACEETMRVTDEWQRACTELQSQIVAIDADNARLIASLTAADEVQETLRRAIADRNAEIDRLTRQNVIAIDAFNTLVDERHANGASAGSATGVTHLATDGPPWWINLDEETNDWRISVEAGRRTFRQLPKHARLLLFQAFCRHIGNGAMPKQPTFDQLKPEWMPTAGAFVGAFGGTWYDLAHLSPTAVAP